MVHKTPVQAEEKHDATITIPWICRVLVMGLLISLRTIELFFFWNCTTQAINILCKLKLVLTQQELHRVPGKDEIYVYLSLLNGLNDSQCPWWFSRFHCYINNQHSQVIQGTCIKMEQHFCFIFVRSQADRFTMIQHCAIITSILLSHI